MANDQRMNMQMQVEDVKRAIAQETDPQKKAELAQHGAAYLEDLAKQNPEAYQSVLQANRRQGQAQQGQGGSILRPANPEDGLVDIRQSRAKSSGYLGTPAAEAQKQAWIQRQQLVNPSIVSGDTPVSPQGSIVKQPYQPLGPNPQTTNAPAGYSQAEQDAMMSQYDARDQMQAKARQDALDLQNFRRNQGNKTPVEQQGIFDRIGSGLKSVGRGMGQYTEKLFNDPNRMAMLQGGLSMMNPNSYYDKQGFGSVFQGLQAGLGQAQAGHKGVLDRRALVQETASKKAAADKAMRGGAYTNVKMPNGKTGLQKDGRLLGVFSTTFKPESSPALIKLMDMRDAAYAAGNQTRGDEIQQQIFKMGFVPDVFSSTNTGVFQHHVQPPGSRSKYRTSDILPKGNKPPTQAQVAQAGSNVSAAGRGIANVGALYEKLSDSGAMVGGELFGGNIVSNWNTFVDNIGWDNLSNDNRSEIDSLQNALKRDLPKEFLQDDKSKSNFDKKLVLDSFGYDKVSSRKTKMKAMPDVLGLLYEKYVKNSQVMGDPPVGLRAYLEHKKIPEALIKKVEDKSNGSFSADPFKSDKKKFQAGSGKGKFY